MADYRLKGRHSLSLDRTRTGKYGDIRVRCELVVYRLQFQWITDTVLTGQTTVPFLRGISINDIYRGNEWFGARIWSFALILTIEDEHVRTTSKLGRRLSDEQLRYAPWTALSRLERALRHAWATQAGSGNLSKSRHKSLEILP